MKKLIFTILALSSLCTAQAQMWKADGTVLTTTFAMKDINNVNYDLFTMLNAGKHVVIDFSATWCGPCWSYHQTHVLDNYFDKYGPTGTAVKDAQVFLYEVDQSTDATDLNGTTGSTQGNWITGTTHPICNEASTGSVLNAFLAPGTVSYSVPAVFVVCKNKQMYKVSTVYNTETTLRNYIASKCGVGPLSNDDVMDINFSYNIYPNPAADLATIHLDLETPNSVSYTITNALGEVVLNGAETKMNEGTNDISVNTSAWSTGMYFVNLQVGNRVIKAKLSVQH
ncbi:MAG: T9SS type A sorting domain-containing protein [Bacteroidetes bacterium]|nr:T9SS type A sorting domain-containing protein [Bacteroidota bacterium]